jgi:hypothetical protein
MRSKRRQTNIQILNRTLEDISIQEPPKIVQSVPKPLQPAKEEVKLIEKPKKARGAPKAALINTSKLLTG